MSWRLDHSFYHFAGQRNRVPCIVLSYFRTIALYKAHWSQISLYKHQQNFIQYIDWAPSFRIMRVWGHGRLDTEPSDHILWNVCVYYFTGLLIHLKGKGLFLFYCCRFSWDIAVDTDNESSFVWTCEYLHQLIFWTLATSIKAHPSLSSLFLYK